MAARSGMTEHAAVPLRSLQLLEQGGQALGPLRPYGGFHHALLADHDVNEPSRPGRTRGSPVRRRVRRKGFATMLMFRPRAPRYITLCYRHLPTFPAPRCGRAGWTPSSRTPAWPAAPQRPPAPRNPPLAHLTMKHVKRRQARHQPPPESPAGTCYYSNAQHTPGQPESALARPPRWQALPPSMASIPSIRSIPSIHAPGGRAAG